LRKSGRLSEITRASAPWFLQLADDEEQGEETGPEED
jgi:hypothetical protein